MFGSCPFGQTSSPFGSQPTFGQNTNAGNNPFAPNPFGATSPFGAQSGGSFFGNNSTGVFGNQNSSPAPVFGASSSPAFGTSTPTFGSSSPTPTFGSTSAFGQKPTFGGFGATPASTSSFGGSFQQQQPAFGSNLFNAGSQPAFGTPSTPTFGSSSNPAFGASTSAPAFGSTTSPAFGNTTSAFGVSGSPMFGSTTTSAFGATPGFGAASSPGFGAASSSAFGTTNANAFGSSSTPAFSFSSSPSFGQSVSPFGAQSSPSFGQSTSPFGAQSSQFGAQTTTPFGSTGFGQSNPGSQQGGSRVVPYAPTPEVVDSGTQAGKLESISAMPAYKDKSHEELRWEDYQRGDKGGPAPTAQTTPGLTGFGTSNSAFGQSSSNPFSGTAQASPFATPNQAFSGSGFNVSSTPAFNSTSPFGSSTTTNPFGSAPPQTQSLFNSTPAFGSTNTPSQFGTSTSIFGSLGQGTSTGFPSANFGNTQSSPLFQSTTATLGQSSTGFGQSPSTFGQNSSTFGQNSSTFGQNSSTFGQNSSTFGQNSSTFGQNSSTLGQNAFGFNSPSTGFGGMFSSTPSLTSNNAMGFGQTPTLPFQSTQPPQSGGSFGFGNFGQTASAGSSGFGGGTSSLFAQNTFSQPSTLQNSVVPQPAPANPFGTLPVLPQMSFGRAGNSPSIQYGISSLPVVDKPAPVRISSVLTSRHLSQRRIRLPARRYHPQPDGHRVPFFNDDEETPNTPKADALFIPRENPRTLVIRPVEQKQSQLSAGKTTALKSIPGATQENGKSLEAVSAPHINGFSKDKDKESIENGFDERTQAVKQTQKSNGTSESYSITLTGHRAGEAAIAYEHGPEIEALMPKLRNSDYYTEPRIQELAAKERVENGYCQRVKNFVIGRHGYGSIKFIGETDVRGLDLESLVQFNNREVTVYMDESKKPPVGQGLNKRAEVTLLNIKCSDKKTGLHYTEGPRIQKYKEMLKRKAEDQGAEFVSYDPVKGEWKFRVEHFSRYSLREEYKMMQTSLICMMN